MFSNLTTGPASFKSWTSSCQKSTGRRFLRHLHHWVQQQHSLSSKLVGTGSASVLLTSGGLTQAPLRPSMDMSEDWAGAISSVTVMALDFVGGFCISLPLCVCLSLGSTFTRSPAATANKCNHSQLRPGAEEKLESSSLGVDQQQRSVRLQCKPATKPLWRPNVLSVFCFVLSHYQIPYYWLHSLWVYLPFVTSSGVCVCVCFKYRFWVPLAVYATSGSANMCPL